MEPVVLRHVALRDGDEARQPRLRRQQVVERRVEPPGTLGVGQAIADREDAAPPVVEEVEPHGVGERDGARRASARSASPDAASAARAARATRRATARHQNATSASSCSAPSESVAPAAASQVEPRARRARRARDRRPPRRVPSRDDRAREPVDSVARPRSAACTAVGSTTTLGEEARRVGKPGEHAAPASAGARRASAQALRQRDQRAGEVAAVDGRDVARVQRRQRRRVVPVEEVALGTARAPRASSASRSSRSTSAVGREVAEIVRGQRREQAHADVGRRGAPRQLRARRRLPGSCRAAARRRPR